MGNIKISIINASTLIKDEDMVGVTNALQTQVREHFAPVWGINADLFFYPKGTAPPAGNWWLVLLDDSDQSGALGYHELTPDNLPIGKVFVASDIKAGSSYTNTISHELLEMLADPWICQAAYDPTSPTLDRIYAWEVADAPEDDKFGYIIDANGKYGAVKVLVSDFVFPAWFQANVKRAQYDYKNYITAPLQLLEGGYIGYYDIAQGQWMQAEHEQHKPAAHVREAAVGSRRHRRTMPRHHWKNSTVKHGK